jgi:hypothetical protein
MSEPAVKWQLCDGKTLIPPGHNCGLHGFLPAYRVVTTMAIILWLLASQQFFEQILALLL